MRVALTIAGSDSSGGAGIQADLKTFQAHGVFGMSVITAVTAQNTQKVYDIQEIRPRLVQEQIRCLFDDVEIIVLNETELAGFADADITGASTLSEFQSAARGLLSRSDQWAVITLGRKGALAISPEQSMTVSAFEMTAIDTTGAGDCFCGVLSAVGVGLVG